MGRAGVESEYQKKQAGHYNPDRPDHHQILIDVINLKYYSSSFFQVSLRIHLLYTFS